MVVILLPLFGRSKVFTVIMVVNSGCRVVVLVVVVVVVVAVFVVLGRGSPNSSPL